MRKFLLLVCLFSIFACGKQDLEVTTVDEKLKQRWLEIKEKYNIQPVESSLKSKSINDLGISEITTIEALDSLEYFLDLLYKQCGNPQRGNLDSAKSLLKSSEIEPMEVQWGSLAGSLVDNEAWILRVGYKMATFDFLDTYIPMRFSEVRAPGYLYTRLSNFRYFQWYSNQAYVDRREYSPQSTLHHNGSIIFNFEGDPHKIPARFDLTWYGDGTYKMYLELLWD